MKDLTEIKGIAAATADSLNDAGIETVQDLARADPSTVEDAAPHLNGHQVVARASQECILIQTGEEVATEHADKSYLTTGIDGLDSVLNGGWEEGMLAGIYGSSGEGKSQIAMHSLTAAVEETGKPSLYVETEPDNYRPERLSAFATDDDTQNQVYKIGGVDNLTDQFNAYEAIAENFDADSLSLIAIDSFNSHFRGAYQGRAELSERSVEMKEHLTRLQEVAKELSVPILMLLQVYGSPDAYSRQDNIYGGSVMTHSIGYFLRMSNATGDLKQATVENHPGLPTKGVLIDIADDGIHYVKDA